MDISEYRLFRATTSAFQVARNYQYCRKKSSNLRNDRTGFLNLGVKVMPISPAISVPVIQAESKSFKDKMQIEIKSQNLKDEIYFIII